MIKNFFLISVMTLCVIACCEAQEPKSANLLFVEGNVPTYPILAKTARVSGRVQVKVTVQNGAVVQADVISGHPLLASPTVDNVKTWKFDKTGNAAFTVTFVYELEKDEVSEASNPKIELELPTFVRITAKPTKRPCQDCNADVAPE